MNGLTLKSEFDDFESLLEAKKDYEKASKSVLVTRGSYPLKGDNNIARKFRYSEITYECKAGTQRASKSTGHRSSSTYKMNCQAKVKLQFNGEKLVVTQSELHHRNHSLDDKTFDHYPENVKLSEKNIAQIEELLAAGANKRKIKANIMKQTGKPVLMKSVHNVQTKMQQAKQNADGNVLQDLYDVMVTIPGAKARFISNSNDEFVGVFYQEERMRHLFDKYPELVLYDATYKTNNRNLSLFIQLCIDSNGETEIVSLYICVNETREGIGAMLDIFKEWNPKWHKTRVFIGDKDFSDRAVFGERFPGAVLQICLFHVFQTFGREITTTKREITTLQRTKALEILQRLAYSETSECYDELYEELCDLNLELVTKYYNENWHNIRDEWTMFGRNHYAHYMNTCNNRSERINRTIKGLGNRNSSLLVFFENLSTTVSVFASEKDIKAIRSTMKVERKRFSHPVLEKYNNLLTSFAFGKVEKEFELSEKFPAPLKEIDRHVFRSQSGYTVVADYCTCTFFKAMKLPCRHLFKLMKRQSLDLFMPTVCLYRWTKQCYNKSHPALSTYNEVPRPQPMAVQKMKVPDEVTKYKKASTITKQINDVVSTMPSDRYNHYMEKLAELRNELFQPDDELEDDNANLTPTIPIRTNSTSPDPYEFNSDNDCIDELATIDSDNDCTTEPATIDSDNDSTTEPATIDSDLRTVTAANTNNDYSEGGPSYQMNKNCRNDIGTIILPPTVASVGRPKGKVNTAITLKRKSNDKVEATPAKVKFIDLNLKNQSLNIINWLTNKTATQILSKKTATHEIIQDPTRFNRLRNDAIDLSGTKNYFHPITYKYLCNEIEKLEGKPWHCAKCRKNLSGEQVMCKSCLDWFHVNCVKAEGIVDFFCIDCKGSSQLIVL